MLLMLLGVAVTLLLAGLLYVRARSPCQPGVVVHSQTEPLLGITRLLVSKQPGEMLWTQMLAEHKRNGWQPIGWSALFQPPVVQIVAPEDIGRVLKDSTGHFSRGAEIRNSLRRFLTPGSLGATIGEEWRRRRAALTHLFAPRVQKDRMAVVFGEKAQLLVRVLARCNADCTVDVQDVLKYYTFDTTNSVAFKYSSNAMLGNKRDVDFSDAIEAAGARVVQRLTSPFWQLDEALQLSEAERNFTTNLEKMFAHVDEAAKPYVNSDNTINEEAMRDGTMSGIFLERAVEEDQANPRHAMRTLVISLAVGGRDTVASALTSCIYLLCLHPEWQERLHKEAIEVFDGDVTRHLTFKDVEDACPIAQAVFKEAMRLLPPAPINLREVDEDVELPSGVQLRRGQRVMWSPYVTNRNPKVWGDDAEEFNPARWLGTRQYDEFEYNVFSGGPRYCPGRAMGLLQGKMTLVTLFSQLRFRLREGYQLVERDALAMTFTDPGMPVYVERVA